MSEQQRVFLTVLACLGILIGWQYLLETTSPPPKTPSTSEAQVKIDAAKDAASADVAAKPAAPSPEASAGEAPVLDELEISRVPLSTPQLDAALSSWRASVVKADLKHYDERLEKGEDRVPVSLVRRQGESSGEEAAEPTFAQAQLLLEIGDVALDRFEVEAAKGDSVALSRRVQGARAQVSIAPSPHKYTLDYVVRVDNQSDAKVEVRASIVLNLDFSASSASMFAPPSDQLFGMCATGDDVERFLAEDVAQEGPKKVSAPRFAGLDRQYFVAAVVPSQVQDRPCEVVAEGGALFVRYGLASRSLDAGASLTEAFSVYLGPKRTQELEAVSGSLKDVVDYNIWGIPLGFLARPMVFLLNVFHSFTGSFGIAIMLLTLTVKLLLFPVTYKSIVSMRKMQLLKPELDRIKKQFENDRERQQLEQMKLFRDKGINPVGGCLPMLLQMPVWLALYRSLWTAVDLYQEPFLWLDDLTAKEPFPILALLLGVLTFVQQKITPTAADNQQAKIMLYMMPVMLTVFMIALPSGLVLYILVNSVLTIVQQLAINKRQITL